MSIFEFYDYRAFLKQNLQRGMRMELAKRLAIHASVVSQVFSGQREFSEEQALEISELLELTPLETKYLRLLVRFANASTQKLKSSLRIELEEIRRASKSTATRVQAERTLTDIERAIFYSNWMYSACRLYCTTAASGRSLDEVAHEFGISRVQAGEIFEFLTKTGLTVAERDKYKIGPLSTFVDRDSPFLKKHLLNWRVKATQALDSLSEDELMYSGPCSLSVADFARLREELVELIKRFSKMAENSASETVACFSIDLFKLIK